MQRTVHASEEPSRISQALVVCFSIAVVLMAGWLALTIILSRYVTASAIDEADVVTSAAVSASAPVSAPVYVENVSREADEPSVTARLNSAFDLLPRDIPPATAAPPRSALPLASPTEPPLAATSDLAYPTLSIATAAQDASYRSIPAPAAEPLGGRTSIEASDATADLTPAPPPRRGRTTPVPVPRPRPRLEADEVQPVPDQSFLEMLFGQRQ